MTTNTTRKNTSTGRISSQNRQQHIRPIQDLEGRPCTPEEREMLDKWLRATGEQMAALVKELEIWPSDTDTGLVTLHQQLKFGTSSYRIPTLLCKTADEAYARACEAHEAKQYQSMAAHLRMVEHLLDFIYSWGYGVHVSKATGDTYWFCDEDDSSARVYFVSRPNDKMRKAHEGHIVAALPPEAKK